MPLKVVEKLTRHKKPTVPKYLVSLDIGTEFVKALICKVTKEGLEVIGTGRQRQRLTDMQSGAVTDIAGVVDNCDTALKMAEKMSGIIAHDVVIGIAGELVKGTSTIVKYRRLKPEVAIEMPELKQILDQVQAKALTAAKEQLNWETGYEELEVKLVNTAVVDVQIDGYRITNPIGFQGKDVSIQLFCAFAPLVHIGALQRVAKDLDLNLVSITAEPFAVARSVGEQESAEFSAIFIDLGGGTTDIALVNNGGVEGTKMFAIGGRSFTKRLAQVTNLSYEKAEEMKLAYSAGSLDRDKIKIVEDAFAADIQVWLSGVELSLAEFNRIDHLPAKILLCGGGTGLPLIVKALKEADWYKNLPFTRAPSVNHITPEQVVRIKDRTGKLINYADITPMALANIGFDTIGNADTSRSILEKLTKMIES